MKGKGTASPAPWLESRRRRTRAVGSDSSICFLPLANHMLVVVDWWSTSIDQVQIYRRCCAACAVRGWIRAACARHAAERLASDLHKLQRQRRPAGMRVRSAPEIGGDVCRSGLHPLQRWEGLHVSH